MKYVKVSSYAFACDNCGQIYSYGIDLLYVNLKDAIAAARLDGWSIGKDKITCDECKRKG